MSLGPTSGAQGITSVCIIEGTNNHGVDAIDLCFMPDIALLTDFKPPKFEKYKGSSCPRVHLAMYCWKMAAYIHQDKILVHCFQDNLTGGTLIWYVNLEKGLWHSTVPAPKFVKNRLRGIQGLRPTMA
ncbi:hypothetical protein CR513_12759, partial [Mucuna pruriens]